MVKRRPIKKRKTILYGEDDRAMSLSMTRILEAEGFNVLRATCGNEVLTLFKKYRNKIDIVILDIRMPMGRSSKAIDVDAGFSIARLIKKYRPKLPLLALSAYPDPEIKRWFSKYGVGFFNKVDVWSGFERFIETIRSIIVKRRRKQQPRCFIVHGHDTGTLSGLRKYLETDLELKNVIVLRDQPTLGRTIIEKFEDEAGKVNVVFILLTPDDKSAAVSASDDVKRRARQNVIFEMGYFLAKLQRRSGRVILLHKGDIELPSDISGIVYIDISKGVRKVKAQIQRELVEWL